MAGEELGVSRSAVSQQVSRLEARLGRDLFQRRQGRVQPTRAAAALADAYRAAAEALEKAASVLAGDNGSICVSLPRSLAGRWLAVRFGRMVRTLPGLTIEVHPDRARPDLGRVDAAVVVDTQAPIGGVMFRRLYDERFTPLCSSIFLAEHRLRDPAALNYLPLISHNWRLWTAWFEHAGLRPPTAAPSHRLADADLALEAASEGHGVALGCVLARQFSGGRLVAPFDIEVSTGRHGYVVWSDDSRDVAATSAFIDWLIEEIGERDRLDAAAPGVAALAWREVPGRNRAASAPAFEQSD